MNEGATNEKTFRLLVLTICMVLCLAAPCQAQLANSKFSHLLFVQFKQDESVGQRTEIAYQSLPSVRSSLFQSKGDESKNRKLPQPFDSEGEILAVSQSAVYFLTRNQFIERLEFANPEKGTFFPGGYETISLSPKEDFFFASPFGENVVFRFDVLKGSRELLVDRSDNHPNLLGGTRIPDVAVSTDGGHVATATYLEGDNKPKFAIEIFELPFTTEAQPKVQKIVRGELLGTGGGFPVAAPAMFWLDSEKLLLLTPKSPPNQEGEEKIVVLSPAAGENSHELMQLDINSGSLDKLFEMNLQDAAFRSSRPGFWQRFDENFTTRLMLGNLEIDLNGKTVTKSDKLSSHYEFRGEGHQRSLWYKDVELASKVTPQFVSISPDGQQIAWFSPVNPMEELGFSTLQRPQHLYHHSQATGITQLTTGTFSSPRSSFWDQQQLKSRCLHWVPSP